MKLLKIKSCYTGIKEFIRATLYYEHSELGQNKARHAARANITHN